MPEATHYPYACQNDAHTSGAVCSFEGRGIYVIGHKNSDLDAVASAYAYARLLRMTGQEQAIAARHGPLMPEVRFVFERFQVDPPEAVADVYLHVRDVMQSGGVVQEIVKRECDACRPEEPVREVQPRLMRCGSLPVVDAEGKLVGSLSCTDLLHAHPKRVILVDQNELSQAIDGVEEAEVLAIIDHHRTTDIHMCRSTIFRAEPVGCTATMIAGLYHEAGIAIPRDVAGLLLSALLYETQMLRSLTCTVRDERVAAELAEIAGEQVEKLGQALFATVTADLHALSAEPLLTSNIKEFTFNEVKFAIGTVETACPATLEKRSEELLAAMQHLVQKRKYTSYLFMIVDIVNMRSTLLVYGAERAVSTVLGLPLAKDQHTVSVAWLTSRKKQLVPLLPRIATVLKGTDLTHCDVSGAALTGGNLRKANLKGMNLFSANLRGADLKGANLSKALLVGADLSEANLSAADLSAALLNSDPLSRTNLSRANLSRANLSEANLSRANLSGTQLQGAILWRTLLENVDLSGADLSGADLSGANLRGANLREAKLRGADLSIANLRGADLGGAELTGANLDEANL